MISTTKPIINFEIEKNKYYYMVPNIQEIRGEQIVHTFWNSQDLKLLKNRTFTILTGTTKQNDLVSKTDHKLISKLNKILIKMETIESPNFPIRTIPKKESIDELIEKVNQKSNILLNIHNKYPHFKINNYRKEYAKDSIKDRVGNCNDLVIVFNYYIKKYIKNAEVKFISFQNSNHVMALVNGEYIVDPWTKSIVNKRDAKLLNFSVGKTIAYLDQDGLFVGAPIVKFKNNDLIEYPIKKINTKLNILLFKIQNSASDLKNILDSLFLENQTLMLGLSAEDHITLFEAIADKERENICKTPICIPKFKDDPITHKPEISQPPVSGEKSMPFVPKFVPKTGAFSVTKSTKSVIS